MIRLVPTRLGIFICCMALAVTFAALNTGINLIYLLASFLYSIILMGMALPLLVLRRMEAVRTLPEHVFAGVRFSVGVKLRNPKHWAATSVIVEDYVRLKDHILRPHAHLARIGPKEEVVASYRMAIERRGCYNFEALRLTCRYPMGLFRATKVIRQPQILWVYPALGVLSSAVQMPARLTVETGSGQSARRGGHQEFYGLREYQHGDSLRIVHWKSSARLSRLMVKEFERDEAQVALIVLAPPRNITDKGVENAFETAVSFAATLARRMVMQGRSVSVAMLCARPERDMPPQWRVAHNPSRRYLTQEVLRFLATLDPSHTHNTDSDMLVSEELPSDAATVLVTCGGKAEAVRKITTAGVIPDRVFDVTEPTFKRLFLRPTDAGGEDVPLPSPSAYPYAGGVMWWTCMMVVVGALAMSLGMESVPAPLVLAVLTCAVFGLIEWRKGRPLYAPQISLMIVTSGGVLGLFSVFGLGRNVAVTAAEYLLVSQFALLLLGRGDRQLAWVFLNVLAQFAVGAIRTVDISYGLTLMLFAVISTQAMGKGRVWFDSLSVINWRAEPGALQALRKTCAVVKWTNSLGLSVCVMAITAVVFFMLPRIEGNLLAHTRAETLAVTGFASHIELGDIGRILPDTRKVMEVQLFAGPKLDVPFQAAGPGLLLRGIALDHYDGKSWSATPGRGVLGLSPLSAQRSDKELNEQGIRVKQVITLEPMATDVVFCLYPVERVEMFGGRPVYYDWIGGNVYAKRPYTAYFRYTAISRLLFGVRKLPEKKVTTISLSPKVRAMYLQLPPNLSPRIRELARTVAERAGATSDLARAEALKQYLENPRNFRYTLDVTCTPGREPVEDFLFTQRAGHCEYFAAAMVVLLRTLGIPARLVNGFRLGEWNELGGFYTVRQSDAHSWLEAYVEGFGWMPFDPSPQPADATVTGRLGRVVWQMLEVVESKWVNYVIGYDRGEQQAFLAYLRAILGRTAQGETISRLRGMVGRMLEAAGFEGLGKRLTPASAETMEEEAPPFEAVWLIILALLTLAIIAAIVKWGGLLFALHKVHEGARAEYERFLGVMARRGFRKRDTETPLEFLERIRSLPVADLEAAQEVTTLFTLIRYGGVVATKEWLHAMRKRVKQLAARQYFLRGAISNVTSYERMQHDGTAGISGG